MTFFGPKQDSQIAQAKRMAEAGEKGTAIITFYGALTRRRDWGKDLEEAAIMFISLAAEKRKDALIKDCLIQYRTNSQASNPQSLGIVIEHLLACAQNNMKEAEAKSVGILNQIEDLDELEDSPEAIALGAVSGESSKNRADLGIVAPALKFLWQTYRMILDTIRTNYKLDTLYEKTAFAAFDFCVKYIRKREFHHLSEQLRLHVTKLMQLEGQQIITRIYLLEIPESIHRQLEIRLKQMDSA
ncbi:MAG: putative eukaryotic translation initiation factor 3 subunit A, partial [Streblomastix strix]